MVRADYILEIQGNVSSTHLVIPGLTDLEYQLLQSIELRLNCEAGFPFMKINPVKRSKTSERNCP